MKLFILFLLLRSYYGLDCSIKCVRCDKKSGNCVDCVPGLFGPNCETKCRGNCKNDACILKAGRDVCKEGCQAGFYGSRCLVPCRPPGQECVKCSSGCKDGYCRDYQKCFSGCYDSRYGLKCFNCSRSCKECNYQSGQCKECISGYGGPQCSVQCENCLESCNIGGCYNGCKPGYYGAFCNNVCSTNCLDTCEQGTGNCNDCQDGRYGPFCQSRCNTGCTHETCTLNGHCKDGCKDGYFGPSCASRCEEACIKNRCTRDGRFCIQVCNTCAKSCGVEPTNCSQACLSKLLNNLCNDTMSVSTTEPPKDEETLVTYLAASLTGLLVMMVALFIYLSCRVQRIRRFVYGSVSMPAIQMSPLVEQADQSVPSVAHEYDEVEDIFVTIDLTNPIIAEVFGDASASAGKSTSFPRMANYTTMKCVSAEGLYLAPKADPEQRPMYRHSW